MEALKKGKTSAYLAITEQSFAFPPSGEIRFQVDLKGEALSPGNVFIVDIYANDDHSHPDGHAGWWELPLTGKANVEVCLRHGPLGLRVTFDGEESANFWRNDAFELAGRTLVMHLVIRAWRSTTILFNDPLLLFPDDQTQASSLSRPTKTLPEDIPSRWFVWPPQRRVLLIFNVLNSQGMRTLHDQLRLLLAENDIPCQCYAHQYDAHQRTDIRPVEYLLHECRKDDIAFFVLAEGGDVLPLVAGLPCKKILYHMHLPDYRRYQAFDAEFARKLAEVQEQEENILAFDGICYESEYTCNMVRTSLERYQLNKMRKEWQEKQASMPAGSPSSFAGPLLSQPALCKTTEHFCYLSEERPAYLPPYLRITTTTPELPKTLGIFPPSLWRRNWDDVTPEPCSVPERFILSVGSFRPDKHHEETLRIFAALAEMDDSIGLVIAGWPAINGYWDYISFLRENRYQKIKKRIVFLQSCETQKILWLYTNAQLMISACSYEGYSNSIIDAAHFGLPIISKKTYTSQKLYKQKIFMFDNTVEPENIAKDIHRILSTKKIYSEFKEKSLEITHQSQKNNAHDLLNAIQETL